MGQNSTILLVDDTENDVLLFRRALHSLGYEGSVVVFDSVTRASVYLKQEGPHENAARPTLIVSDSVVDHESGVDLLEWVRVHPRFKDIPFVILTGNADPTIIQRSLQLGATAVFQKPTDFADLVATARELLEKGSSDSGSTP